MRANTSQTLFPVVGPNSRAIGHQLKIFLPYGWSTLLIVSAQLLPRRNVNN